MGKSKCSCLVWSGLVSSPSHNFIPSHHTPSHPSQSTYPISYFSTSFPFYLTLSYPIPLHPMPSHPSHFTYPIPPHFLFFLSHPTLFHPTPSHSITLILFHSPHPPACLFRPMPSHPVPSPSTSSPSPVDIHASHPQTELLLPGARAHWWWRPLGAVPHPGCVSVKAETQ